MMQISPNLFSADKTKACNRNFYVLISKEGGQKHG